MYFVYKDSFGMIWGVLLFGSLGYKFCCKVFKCEINVNNKRNPSILYKRVCKAFLSLLRFLVYFVVISQTCIIHLGVVFVFLSFCK